MLIMIYFQIVGLQVIVSPFMFFMLSKFLQQRHTAFKIFAELCSKTSGKSCLCVMSLIPLLESLFNPNELWPQRLSSRELVTSMLLNPTSAELTLVIIPFPSGHPLSLWLSDTTLCFFFLLLVPSSLSPLRTPSSH